MQSHLNRVKAWMKYNDFETLKNASVGEIIFYIKEMFLEAERRRNQFQLPSRDRGMIGGYDVRSISPKPPYRDEFVLEKEIEYKFIQEGFISSRKTPLAIFKYQNGEVLGLYLPILDPNFMDR